ncbi:MAG: hypothetical protein JWM88_476 [Verrucomicrobia bacterium]|nr:hypothetical protein [Verrucomicrobiota bacterium]
MIIDHDRLQAEAWAEFHAARKRLEKAAADLHHHETSDVPAYDAWLHRTFPQLLTAIRNLRAEVEPKAAKVHAVQTRVALFGGSARRFWREINRPKPEQTAPGADDAGFEFGDGDDDDFFADDDQDPDPWGEGFSGALKSPAVPAPTMAAREIYRRLVQRLHPDRGGEWTPARERLWHEVQEAWSAGDSDWLARLEVEWETVNDILGPTSAVSRLRAAIEELHGARRDTERKLRAYRGAPAWRFPKAEKKRAELRHRIEGQLRFDLKYLQSKLVYLNEIIADWEDSRESRGVSGRSSRPGR